MPRYIDADEIQYTMLYKENWITNTGVEKQGVWKDDIDKMPTADVVEVGKVYKIYEKLADLFGIPCNYSPCDEIMLENERCREDCGNISDAECWRRYFEIVCDGERMD